MWRYVPITITAHWNISYLSVNPVCSQFFRHNIHNKYNIYYFGFIFCEFLNLVVTVLCFFATNRFLANRWLGYGFKVWHYYQLPLEEQEMKMAGKYIHTNPMCYTFPR